MSLCNQTKNKEDKMKVNVNYPLPTVHLNGTPKEMLLEGEEKIQAALNSVSEALQECVFHSRDYYMQEGNAFTRAVEERMKHVENLTAFKEYNLEQVMHLRSQD